jgi:DNA-binding XRE family transcriptional regulator
MRKLMLVTAIALLAIATVPVWAMPFPLLAQALSNVTPVAMGCGVGRTRGPYGNCHPMGGYGYGYHPYYHPYAYAHPYYHPYAHPLLSSLLTSWRMRIAPALAKAARQLLGLSQDDIAGRLGVSKTVISLFERDIILPILNIDQLRAVFEASLDERWSQNPVKVVHRDEREPC